MDTAQRQSSLADWCDQWLAKPGGTDLWMHFDDILRLWRSTPGNFPVSEGEMRDALAAFGLPDTGSGHYATTIRSRWSF